MAADIEHTRTGDREVPAGRYGRFTVRFEPEGIYYREKGSSKEHGPLPWYVGYEVVMKMEARLG